MPATAPPPLPSAPVWCEIGRPSSGEAQDWTTWVSPLGDGDEALYRSLVLADGAIAVTVDLHARDVPGTRTVHRGRCGLPRDPDQIAERVRLLLGAADRAAAKALGADRGSEEVAAAGHWGPTPRRVPDAPRSAGRDGGVSATAAHGGEDRGRERACREAAAA